MAVWLDIKASVQGISDAIWDRLGGRPSGEEEDAD